MKASSRDIYTHTHIHTDTYTCIYGHIYHIYHIYHISFLRQKKLRATCETWPHKRKIFHLKSKRRPKSRQIPPAKCCCHHHSQGPPQESICAAAKGPQVAQQEPPASQKSHVTTSGGCTRGQVGSEPSPRQLCSHRAEPWHNSQTPHPWSWAGSQHPLTESPRSLLPLPTGASSTSGSPGHQGGYQEKLFIRRGVKWVQWENKVSVCCTADTWIPTSVAPTRRILLKGCGLIFRVYKRTHTLSFLTVLLSYTWATSIFSLTSWWRKPTEAMQGLKKTAVLLWSWIILFQSHNVRFLRHQFPVLIVQIWELLSNNKNQINTSYQIPYEWI